ncbi:cob(I)yrinic acid a,c-diamide adenosyltransferase [Candidatus Nomurabacteria bacterium]|nr:cob(I)yrinic acid a,c-diamide adenosyltransferase [Candidatus Nomurabacteria bacterium]
MLYTRKGDKGTTKTFGCNQERISKDSAVPEALGALDEINSFLGVAKIKAKQLGFDLGGQKFEKIIHDVQKNLFIIQAELAGASKKIEKNKIIEVEKLVDCAEKTMPPIKSFSIPGGSELSAVFDCVRAIIRRAERRVVTVSKIKTVKINQNTLAYLNRLSSLFFAMSRLTNHKSGINEESPDYK